MIIKKQPIYFATQTEFREWLEENHNKETELFVGYYKVGSGRQSMTWSESVDQAICFGWIDGIRKSIDEESYCIRFTPRKPKSIWSAINIKKVEELTKKGLMKPSGLTAFKLLEANKSKIYSYENEEIKFPEDLEQLFKSNNKAWEFFQAMPQSYRKPATRWVLSAKQESTRFKRLQELITDSEAGRKIKPMSY
jgi:uncharacterized protein YdeI (YjbR/CyaY-like superfamily)